MRYAVAKKSASQGFLGLKAREVNADSIDAWETPYIETYHQRYVRLLQDCADCEKALGEKSQGEEQRHCSQQAARLYKRLTFELIPLETVRLQSQRLMTLSEETLQQSIKLFRSIGDFLAAEQMLGEYRRRMMPIDPDWQVDDHTLELTYKTIQQKRD